MVGMNQVKKKLFMGIGIGAAVGVVGIGLTLWWSITTIKSYEAGTNVKYNKLYTQDVAVLNRDVIQGEIITADMVSTVNIHKRTVPKGALGTADIVGGVAKFNIPASIPITSSMIAEEILSADIREQEINTVLMPSDLVSGDYVDIRIMYPNGTDYIVLAQKQVGTISGDTMWLTLAEDERLILNGAMVDSYLHEGTKLYATKYADPEAQVKVADENNTLLKGHMEEVIKTAFNIGSKPASNSEDKKDENAEDKKDTTSNATEELSGTIVANSSTVNTIFDLIKEYRNYAATLTRTIENYQPNEQIISMMNSNANIIEVAKKKLNLTVRQNIENGISSYKSKQGEDAYSNVVEGAVNSIEAQKEERKNIIE